MKRFLLFFIIVMLIALGIVIPVKAHASLIRSVPDAGAVLTEPPSEIILEYSEELDAAATEVNLYDGTGQGVIPRPGVIDPGSPYILRLQLRSLPEGVYSTVWRVRSAVDGHVTNGSVGFSVGEGSPPASLLPPPGTPGPAMRLPSTAETLVRWLAYLSITLAVGSLVFGFFIWRPAYQLDVNKSPAADEVIRRWIRWLALGGLAGLGMATILFVMVQAAQAREVPVWSALRLPPAALFSGRIGLFMSLRLILAVALGAFVLRLPSHGIGHTPVWWTLFCLAAPLC